MSSCSFAVIPGLTPQLVCGENPRDPEGSVILLTDCKKDVSKHLHSKHISGTMSTEIELILVRSGFFDLAKSPECHAVSRMCICANHRARLGLQWVASRKKCAVPRALRTGDGASKIRCGNTGQRTCKVTAPYSEAILKATGDLVQVGLEMCRHCFVRLRTITQLDEHLSSEVPSNNDRSDQEDQTEAMEVEPEESEPESQPLSSQLSTGASTSSEFIPTQEERDSRRAALDHLLTSCGFNPVQSTLKGSWEDSTARTRKSYLSMMEQVVQCAASILAPHQTDGLLAAYHQHVCLSQQTPVSEPREDQLLEALAKAYNAAKTWQSRRQVLSIMADKYSLGEVQQHLPRTTKYRLTAARQHVEQHGHGAAIPQEPIVRIRTSQVQVDHFLSFVTSPHVMQDLPFGETTLKLSDGSRVTMPKVITTMIPQRLVSQYQQFAEEEGFSAAGDRTLHRILEECSTTYRKSLQGLDSYSSEGGQAFEDLLDIAAQLADHGKGQAWRQQTEAVLSASKHYLKSDYKVHLEVNSQVADHCLSHALSCPKTPLYQAVCDHQHDQGCEACETLKKCLQDMDKAFTAVNFPIKVVKSDLLYRFSESQKAVDAWKEHQLRSVNQDQARVDMLDSLSPNSALLTQDWAMKWLPRSYRESQSEWFGKRGISWHITEVSMKDASRSVHSITFVHILEQCAQDNSAVLGIMQHVLNQLKLAYPHIDTAYYRSDNAGCYHSASTLAACKVLGKSGITIRRLDFSAPQNGKGPCDRRAAVLKCHVKRHLHEGHDVTTGSQLKAAIESAQLPTCQAYLCAVTSEKTKVKLKDISLLNNFLFSDQGVQMWKAYDVGSGKFLPWSSLCKSFKISTLTILEDRTVMRSVAVPRPAATGVSTSRARMADLFICPEEECGSVFSSHRELQRHLDCDRHQTVKRTTMDTAKLMFAKKVEERLEGVPLLTSTSCDLMSTPLEMGWALKTTQAGVRFSEKQRQYLQEKFLEGERTKQKLDGATVSKMMRVATDSSGNRLFHYEEFLSAQQITGVFSRLASKQRQGQAISTPLDPVETADFLAVGAEGGLPSLVETVTSLLQ